MNDHRKFDIRDVSHFGHVPRRVQGGYVPKEAAQEIKVPSGGSGVKPPPKTD